MTELSSLQTKIEKTLTDDFIPLWFPDLTKDLVEFGWEKLNRENQITSEIYSTNRLLLNNSEISDEIIAEFSKDKNSTDINDVIQLEMLSPQISKIYNKQGGEFYTSSEILNSSIMETLKETFSILRQVPSLNDSVFNLVRVLHLIKSDEAGEYDKSFSEPHLPFSIFVSVPPKRVFADFLRVAEAIVHEAMHLQLTLIESVVPIIINDNEKFYSPWKDEFRSVGGVLHALYVFRVVDCFLQLLTNNNFCLENKSYLDERRTTIQTQICSIREFSDCFDFNSLGKYFTRNLLTSAFQYSF